MYSAWEVKCLQGEKSCGQEENIRQNGSVYIIINTSEISSHTGLICVGFWGKYHKNKDNKCIYTINISTHKHTHKQNIK